MRFKQGDIVRVLRNDHWNDRWEQQKKIGSPVGIVLKSYEGKEPSYRIMVGLKKEWIYETDLLK